MGLESLVPTRHRIYRISGWLISRPRKYDKEALQRLFAFTDKQAFQKLIGEVKKELPPEIAQKLGEVQEGLKTIDELSTVLNILFTKYGDTLKYNFMMFTFGGKFHYMIRMSKRLKGIMDRIAAEAVELEIDINELFMRRFGGG